MTIEIVNLEDRARTAISLGESHFREFKSALQGPPGDKKPRAAKSIARDIGEALVAFANADGGELLVGVEDDGSISGIDLLSPKQAGVLEEAPTRQVHAKTPLPPLRTADLVLDGRRVLYFSVHKSTNYVHLTADGRCIRRRDLETVPIPPEEILLDRRERVSREYDRGYIDGATAADLSEDLVRAVADQLSPGMSLEKCLQYLDLAEYLGPGLRLRRAALLLFSRDPTRWHPRLQVRILKVDGVELLTGAAYNVKSDQIVTGNILQLVEEGWEALRPHLVQTRLGTGARFESTVMFPELACREALVNAVAHRDYSDEGRGIEIYVFDDRLEIRNPGALLSTMRIEDLLRLEGVHQSRNAMISRVLRELGYMRELGEGMRRMFELMRTSELSPPELGSDTDSFRVTLHHKTIYSADQLLWLSQFDSLNLSREQKSIVVLGQGGRLVAPQDIWDNLGIVDTEHYRQLVLSLQKLGILTSSIPKAKAQNAARKKGVSVRNIARFRIAMPTLRPESSTEARGDDGDSVADAPEPKNEVWLGNLPDSLDEREAREVVRKIVDPVLVRIPKTAGKPRGYAFVEFATPELAAKARAKLDGLVVGDRRILARKANPRS